MRRRDRTAPRGRVRRRTFIALGGGAVAWAAIAGAQGRRDRPARIGVLRSAPTPERYLDALRRGLMEKGYAEGRDYVLVYRFGDGDSRKLPGLAASLVAVSVDVILTEGLFAARAARSATTTIPIVMATSPDPVRGGVVASLAHPGGNVTGLASQPHEITGKLFEFLKEIVPGIVRVALIMARPTWDLFRTETAEAGRVLGLEIVFVELAMSDIGGAVRQAVHGRAGGAVVRGRPLFSIAQAKLMVESAAAHRLPVIYESRDFVELGGLMSYGVDTPDLYRRAATFIDKLLRGAKPADLPIEQPTKFELAINVITARSLGLSIPPALLARAHEVIE